MTQSAIHTPNDVQSTVAVIGAGVVGPVRRKIVAAVVGGLPQISFRLGPVFFQELLALLIGACHALILVALSGAHANLGAYRPDGRLELDDIVRIVPHRRPFRFGEMRAGKCFDHLRGCR